MRLRPALLLAPLFCLAFFSPPAPAATRPVFAARVLGMPAGDWPFVRETPGGRVTYLIPSQLDAVRRLPEPERSQSLRTISAHQARLDYLVRTSERFAPAAGRRAQEAAPEYQRDLGEVVMAVDNELALRDNPIHDHEPLLRSLPAYSRGMILAPRAAAEKIRRHLARLGLDRRFRVVLNERGADHAAGVGDTRWIRDTLFVVAARNGRGGAVIAPLAYQPEPDLAHNDLGYLARRSETPLQIVRAPLYFRGGNLALVDGPRRMLLVGADELAMNRDWFAEHFGFTPLPGAVPQVLKAGTGVDDVVVLPNSRNLYHLDMYLTPLAKGQVGLLAPIDPAALDPADAEVLARARAVLVGHGVQVVPIPTSSAWIRSFRSPTNSVGFTERGSGRRRALVPQFPGSGGPDLNALALAAYRAAGVDPVPVEDRFHVRAGNTHCALVALR